MTKPKGASINATHFKFLSNTVGRGNLSLTIDEARRFLYIAKELVNCANWDKKVDQAAISKVAKIMEKAIDEAEYKCNGLPFTLPDNKKLDGGEYNSSNYRAPDLF